MLSPATVVIIFSDGPNVGNLGPYIARNGRDAQRRLLCGIDARRGESGSLAIQSDASAVLALGARREPMPVVQAAWPGQFFPAGDRAPIVAFPVVTYGRLEAIVFDGAHAGGERLDPEETAILAALCRDAGAAYEHLEAMQAIGETARLRAEVTTLHALLRPPAAHTPIGS